MFNNLHVYYVKIQKSHDVNTVCRLSHNNKETQEHILRECDEIVRPYGKIQLYKIFEDKTESLTAILDNVLKIEDNLKNLNQQSMSYSD